MRSSRVGDPGPLVPARERLLDLVPRIGPRLLQTLAEYADGDECVDCDSFVKAVLEAGHRPLTGSGRKGVFDELGSEGRDVRLMTGVLQVRSGRSQQERRVQRMLKRAPWVSPGCAAQHVHDCVSIREPP